MPELTHVHDKDYNKKVNKEETIMDDESNQPVIQDDDAQDITLHSYQDDLDTHGVDRIMDEFGDDPTKDLGISPARFKEELSRYDSEEPSDDTRGEEDDMREEIESLDMDADRDDR